MRVASGLTGLMIQLAFATTAWGSPETDYMLHCQGCHLPDGAGTRGSVPLLAGSIARFATLEEGREYLVRVPGSSMSSLDDAALADVLNWMIVRFGPPEDAARAVPFTPDEVRRTRNPPLTAVEPLRSELLQKLEARLQSPSVAAGRQP